MRLLLDIEIVIGSFIILLSLLYGFIKTRNRHISDHLRNFYLYPLLGFLLSLTTLTKHFFYKLSDFVVSGIESSYVLLEPILISWFFILLFKGKRGNVYIYPISLLLIIVDFLMVIQSGLRTYNHTIIAISNLVFCFYSSLYFVGLFKEAPLKKLNSDASFWIVSGIFFYAAVSLPLFPFNDYFRKTQAFEYARITIAAINFTIIVMHLFFIKAFSCLNKQIKA